jgi:hypothetical protein
MTAYCYRGEVCKLGDPAGIAATCPHPYDALVPQLWEHRVTQPGHYMIEPGGLTGSGVGGHGGPAIAAGQQEHGSGGKGADSDAVPTEPELYLCYAMEGGLFNQYYSHVSALAAAVAIGAKGLVSFRVQWHFTALCQLPCTCACCQDLGSFPVCRGRSPRRWK